MKRYQIKSKGFNGVISTDDREKAIKICDDKAKTSRPSTWTVYDTYKSQEIYSMETYKV